MSVIHGCSSLENTAKLRITSSMELTIECPPNVSYGQLDGQSSAQTGLDA